MHYSAAPCEPTKTSAGCRATHQFLVTLMVHTTKINLATTPTVTSASSMTDEYLVVVIPRDGQHVPACPSCNTSKCNDEVTGWLRRKRLDERRFLERYIEIRRMLTETSVS